MILFSFLVCKGYRLGIFETSRRVRVGNRQLCWCRKLGYNIGALFLKLPALKKKQIRPHFTCLVMRITIVLVTRLPKSIIGETRSIAYKIHECFY